MNPVRAAERGARLLDNNLSRWAEIVDRKSLDLGDCHRCILGQIFRDYDQGANWIERVLGRSNPAYYGFDLDYIGSNRMGKDAYYDELDRTWLREIDKRLADSHETPGGQA